MDIKYPHVLHNFDRFPYGEAADVGNTAGRGDAASETGSVTVMGEKGRDRRLRPRFGVEVFAKATVQLFGSSNVYELVTENISETGLLLNCDARIDHLNAASILEVALYLEPGNPIKFLAKWVRNATTYSIGIVISEISPTDKNRLLDYIDTIQHNEVD
jgi:hypothetical protein